MPVDFAVAHGQAIVALFRKTSTTSDSASTACADSTPSDRASSSGASTPRFHQEQKSLPRWGDVEAETDDHCNDEDSDAAESENEAAPRTTRRRKRRRGRRAGTAKKNFIVTATEISDVAHEETGYLTSGIFVPMTNLNERAAVALSDLGLLVCPTIPQTHRVLHPLTSEGQLLPRTRQPPKPIMLEHVSGFADPASAFSSSQGIASRSPVSVHWPCTPDASEDKSRTRTPSMLWPATPMAWPTMKQGLRVFAADPDVRGYESPQASWGKVMITPVSPAWLACSPSANGRSGLRQRQMQAAALDLYEE